MPTKALTIAQTASSQAKPEKAREEMKKQKIDKRTEADRVEE